MVNGQTVVALIPARGGSKGLPGKNLRSLGGKSLIAWTIDVAKQVAALDRILVSTDDESIARSAVGLGAEVVSRPPHLATDEALIVDGVRYHLREWELAGQRPELVVLLQPTSPFRSPGDIEACLEPVARRTHDSSATFCEALTNPHRAWKLGERSACPFIEGVNPWLPRQALPDAYELNGAVYVFRADALPEQSSGVLFGRIAPVLMPRHQSVDIDTPLDLALAEFLLGADNGGEATPRPPVDSPTRERLGGHLQDAP